MKKLALLLTICFFATAIAQKKKDYFLFSSFREPADAGLCLAYSEDGYHWNEIPGTFLKPELGSKIMRDPSIGRGVDGTYHLVWTTDWKGGNGFGYASSKDLIHWSEQQYIPVMKNEPDVANVWAPELFYDDVKKEYMVIWASTIPFRYARGEEEERNNHRMYYATTKDFKTWSESKLYYEPGFSVIDCVLLKRAKNDYVLILKDNTRPMRNIKVAFAKTPLGPFSKSSESLTEKLSEGPTVVKVDKKYLIYYDNYGSKNYKALSTEDFVHFEDATSKISLPKGHKHGTISRVSQEVLNGLLEKK